jgi:hypothetical protein
MNQPLRLRDGVGPARELLRGAELPVPSASRRRALAFTAAAANLAAGGTALAASGLSVAQSVALCVSLGVVGGGLASLGVSSAISSWEEPRQATSVSSAAARPATLQREIPPAVASAATAAETAAAELAPAVEPDAAPSVQAEPVSRSAASVPSRVIAARPTLFDEQRVIESARAAIAGGDAPGALKLLDSYERRFPSGQFQPEALALRVEALRGRGEVGRAKSLAAEFARRYPQHPLSLRVQGTGP